ncbi:MAG: hypothetical protein VZQ80_05635 [Lachnospiraceae bacterium]|nr:hypothetical protein [Lachnospiraceae bacterium]
MAQAIAATVNSQKEAEKMVIRLQANSIKATVYSAFADIYSLGGKRTTYEILVDDSQLDLAKAILGQ